MERLRSECPLCGGVELPTGNLELREDGKEYAEFSCHTCGSKGWEWAVGRENTVLMEGPIPWLYWLAMRLSVVCFVGVFFLAFVSLSDTRFVGWMAAFLLCGGVLQFLGHRTRTVKRHPVTGEVTIIWGRRFPVTYARFSRDAWVEIVLEEKKRPRFQYLLHGITKDQRTVLLCRSSSLSDVQQWNDVISESLQT